MTTPPTPRRLTAEELDVSLSVLDSGSFVAGYEIRDIKGHIAALEDEICALKLNLASGGGREASGAKIWRQLKEERDAALAEAARYREVAEAVNPTMRRIREILRQAMQESPTPQKPFLVAALKEINTHLGD